MAILIVLCIIAIICIGFYIVFQKKFEELHNEIKNISKFKSEKSDSEDFLNFNTAIKKIKETDNEMMKDYINWLKEQDEHNLEYIHLKRKRNLKRKGVNLTKDKMKEMKEMNEKWKQNKVSKSEPEHFGRFWRDCDWCK